MPMPSIIVDPHRYPPPPSSPREGCGKASVKERLWTPQKASPNDQQATRADRVNLQEKKQNDPKAFFRLQAMAMVISNDDGQTAC